MTYEEFRAAAIEISQGNSVFIDDDIFYQGRSVVSVSIVYPDAEGDEYGNSCIRTKGYFGDTRYQDCLMDMKLQIFNKQKEAANTQGWREENKGAA